MNLVIQQLLIQSAVWFSDNMSSQPGFGFQQESVTAVEPSSFQDLCVGNFVLQLNVKESTETAQVKVIKLSGVSLNTVQVLLAQKRVVTTTVL